MPVGEVVILIGMMVEMSYELLGFLCIGLVGVPLLCFLAVGAVLVVRDTIRQRGKWGLNFKPVTCTQCGTPMPVVRKPANLRQALWGGGTCPECGFELDKWGQPIPNQDQPAKWSALRKVEDAEQGKRPRASHDDRVREAENRTQPGEE